MDGSVLINLAPTIALSIFLLMLSLLSKMAGFCNDIPVRSEDRDRKKIKPESRQYNCLIPLVLFVLFVASAICVATIIFIF